MTNLKQLFLKEKRIEVLLKLRLDGDWWMQKLANKCRVSYSGCRNEIVPKLEQYNLIRLEDESNGRRLIQLTESGEDLAEILDMTVRGIEEVERQ